MTTRDERWIDTTYFPLAVMWFWPSN